MTMPISKIENALYQVINQAGTNGQVIIERPNAPRPKLPYTAVKFSSATAEQFDWTVFDKQKNETAWYGFRELIFSINCYGDNAFEEACSLNSRLAWQKHRDLLRSIVSASIMSKGLVRDLSLLMSDSFEKRASFDIFILANLEDGSSVELSSDYFDKVSPIDWINSP